MLTGGGYLPKILDAIVDAIPSEQVNSDWNATEGPAEILNKPTIPEGAAIIQGTISGSTIEINDQSVLVTAARAGKLVYIKVSENMFCLVVAAAFGGGSKAISASGQILSITD